jgi:hypothetical protein
MKRITLLTAAAAALALLVSGCDLSLNLFSGMGLPEYDAAEIEAKADSDPEGALEEAQDKIETDKNLTDSEREALLRALNDIMDDSSGTIASDKTKQKAALLSGRLEISGSAGAETLMTNTSSVITEVMNADNPSSLSSSDLISSLTNGVSGLNDSELTEMFTALGNAAEDFTSDSGDATGFLTANPMTSDYLSDGEKADLLIMATMSVVISNTYNYLSAGGQQDLIDYIQGDIGDGEIETSLSSETVDPLENFTEGNELMTVVEYADGSDGPIYTTFQDLYSE